VTDLLLRRSLGMIGRAVDPRGKEKEPEANDIYKVAEKGGFQRPTVKFQEGDENRESVGGGGPIMTPDNTILRITNSNKRHRLRL